MSVADAIDGFKDARFGLFVHWGLYALPGGVWQGRKMAYIGEWLQAKFRIPRAEYEQLAAQFNPVGFDAEQWVLTAKNAGMRYLVFTAKHHEGFAMYHSACDHFNIVDATPFGRDVLAELAAACHKHGLTLGLYYSQDLDWHDPDGGDPGPAFPKNFEMSWGNDWDFPDHQAKDFQRYFNGKVLPQVTELLTHYGPIGMVWFDCPMTLSRRDSERLAALVKQLQPECLINTRIGHGLGDYGSLGDNQLPSVRLEGAWETPGTLNDTWGFKYDDQNWKTSREVVHLLAALAAKNTNYLLNVGPQPDGRFPPAAETILREVARWTSVYGDAIYHSLGNPFPYEFGWGWITVSPGGAERFTRINLLLRNPLDVITLYGVQERVRRCFDLGQPDRDLPFTQDTAGANGITGVCLRLTGVITGELPVVVMELDTRKTPRIEQRLIAQGGCLHLMPPQGQLQHGTAAADATERGIGAAGERHVGAGHSELDVAGNLVEWHHPADRIAWTLFWVEPGTYQVDLVTSSRQHSAPWVGGQTVHFAYEGNDHRMSWDATLPDRPSQPPAAGCYAQGVAAAGTLRVRHPGEGRLTLNMLSPGKPEAIPMALNELRLTKIKP